MNMMKKRHFIAIPAVTFAAVALQLTSCTDYTNGLTPEQIALSEAFRRDFGDFDKENDFNLAQRGEVTVTPNGNREVCVYKKAANGYQLIARYDDVTSTRTLGFDIPKGETEILVANGSATKLTTIGGSVTFERGGVLGGGNTGVTRAIPTDPDESTQGYWTSSKWLYKSNDAPLKVKVNDGQDYTYYYYNKSEATSFDDVEHLKEGRPNRDKAIDDFSLISTGEFIIYPTYWNAAVATRVGIYYYDDAGNIQRHPIFGNHIYNESIQYLNSNGDWVTPKSEGKIPFSGNNSLLDLGATQYRSKGIIVNLPVGTKFGFYTPMFEDNPTSRKKDGNYTETNRDWATATAIGLNTNVYIPNNINGAVYTKFGGTTGKQWGLTSNYHFGTTTNFAGEKKYAVWWFKDKDGEVIKADWNNWKPNDGYRKQGFLDAYSESHLNPPDVWDKDYTLWDGTENSEYNPFNYNRHAVMFGMYYDSNGDMVIGAEDAYFLTSDDQSDYDLNDRVFKIYGSQPLVLNNKAQSWHLAFEDLGGSFDWDFNDVVLQLDYVNGQDKARIRPLAAGGILASDVWFKENATSTPVDLGEIHDLLTGSNVEPDDKGYPMLNTESRGIPGNPIEVTITSPSTFSIANAMRDANNSNSSTLAKEITGVYIVTDGNDGENVIAYRGMGKAPAMLVLPTSYESGDKYVEWAWPTEKTDIRSAYSTNGHSFREWVTNHNNAQDWYTYPNTSYVVEQKVAGKYADGSTTAGSEYKKAAYGTTISFPNKDGNNDYVFDANTTFGDATSVTVTFALKGTAGNQFFAHDGENRTGVALGSWTRLNVDGEFTTVGSGNNAGTTNVNIEGMYQVTLSAADLAAIRAVGVGHWAITASANSEIIYIAYKAN